MKSKTFEKLKSYKMTTSEKRYMDDVSTAQATVIAEKDNLIKERQELRQRRNRVLTNARAIEIDGQIQALNNRIKETDRKTDALEHSRRFYADSFQKKMRNLAEKETALRDAKTAQKATEQAMDNARSGSDFDTLMNAERADFNARKAVEHCEEEYLEAKLTVNEVDDPVRTMRDTCIAEITESAKQDITKNLKAILQIANDSLGDIEIVCATAESVDPLRRKETDLSWTDSRWLYILVQDIEKMICEVER